MRICVIGNSHLAAVKQAWDATPARRDIDLVFYGSHSGSLREVRAEQGILRTDNEQVFRALSMTSGMAIPELRLCDFDAFFLHSLVNPNSVLPIMLTLARRYALDGSTVSTGLLEAVAAEKLQTSLLVHMAREIRSATNCPTAASPQPYLSHEILTHSAQSAPYANLTALSCYAGPSYDDAYLKELSRTLELLGVDLLPQPQETIVESWFTDPVYCKGSVRLSQGMDIEHPKDDFAHMGMRYGALVLRDLESFLVTLV